MSPPGCQAPVVKASWCGNERQERPDGRKTGKKGSEKISYTNFDVNINIEINTKSLFNTFIFDPFHSKFHFHFPLFPSTSSQTRRRTKSQLTNIRFLILFLNYLRTFLQDTLWNQKARKVFY